MAIKENERKFFWNFTSQEYNIVILRFTIAYGIVNK